MPPLLVNDNVRTVCIDCGTICTFESRNGGAQLGQWGQPGVRQEGGSTFSSLTYQ